MPDTGDKTSEEVKGIGIAEPGKEGSESQLERSTQSKNSGSKEVVEKSRGREGSSGIELNEWLLVSPGRVGRGNSPQGNNEDIQILASKFCILSLDAEEGEILEEKQNMEDTNEEEDQREELENDLLEDNILSQQEKEKEKSGI